MNTNKKGNLFPSSNKNSDGNVIFNLLPLPKLTENRVSFRLNSELKSQKRY